MRKFRYIDDLFEQKLDHCAHRGCRAPAEHRAPISPDRPGEFQHFCLEHIKIFNKQWDYFKGKESDEIFAFQSDAFTGHRPTWKMHGDPKISAQKLHAALHRFAGSAEDFPPEAFFAPPLGAQDRRALEQLDLEHPSDTTVVKKQFKKLARRYHPDRNHGDKNAEERFKEINNAYRHLIEHYCPTISEL